MPHRPARPCRQRGCPNLVRNPRRRYCDTHHTEIERQYNQMRGSAAARGYGRRWRKLRNLFLSANPVCTDPFNIHGTRIEIATDVDHIVPKRSGGTDEWENLQALCHSCHGKKTVGEGGFKSLA